MITLSPERFAIICQLIAALAKSGVWDKLDCIYFIKQQSRRGTPLSVWSAIRGVKQTYFFSV